MINDKIIAIIGTLMGTCLCLSGLLGSYSLHGFNGITLWFHIPAFIFCFILFIITVIITFIKPK